MPNAAQLRYRKQVEQARYAAVLAESLRTAREAQNGMNNALASTRSAQKMVGRQQENLERDREYAARSIDMAIMSLNPPASEGSSADGGDRLAIAMLLKAPNLASLSTFVRYHAHLGFSRFEFFMDDMHDGVDAPRCNDGAVSVLEELGAAGLAEVIVHRCDRAWWLNVEPEPEPELSQADTEAAQKVAGFAAERGRQDIWEQWGEHIWTDVTARQVLALEVAIRGSLAAGCVWLLHIDVDEAVCCGGLQHQPSSAAEPPGPGAAKRFFARFPAALDQVTLLNHEAAPERVDIDDWFKEVTLFKRSPSAGGDSKHFVAYTNGKSAVRLAQGVVPSGPHRFTSVPPARRLQSIVVSDRVTTAAAARGCTQPDGSGSPAAGEAEGQPFCYPVLLHFVNCGFEEWRRKYKSLGTFNDSFCGKTGIPFKFHLSSRDLLDSGDSSATWAPPPPKCGSPSPRVSRDDDQTAADVAGGSADAAAEAAMRRRREGGKERRVVAAREMYAQTMVHDCQSEACQAKLLSGEFVRTTAVSSIVASLSR